MTLICLFVSWLVEGIPRVVAWRHFGDALLLLLGWLWGLFLSSFRVRVSSEIWLDVGSMFKLGLDVKAASSFGVAPSFKEARFSSRAESREQQLGVSFRPEISVPPTRCSSNEIGLEGRSPAPQGFFLCIHYLPIYVVTWRKYLLTRSNHTLLYSILTSHAHQILAFVLTVNMKPNIRYLTYINSFHAKTNKKGSI